MTATGIKTLNTNLQLDQLKWPSDRPRKGFIKYKFKDCSGVIIRHYSGGQKSYICRITDEEGNRPLLTLGHHPAITPTQAHTKYLEYLASGVISKKNADEQKRKSLKAEKVNTAEALVPLYVEDHLKTIKASTAVNFERVIKNDIKPFLERYENLDEVPHPDIKAYIIDIRDTRGKEPARNALVYFGSFFKWAIEEEKLTINPVPNINAKKLQLKGTPGERALTMPEARLFLTALDTTDRLQSRTRLGLEILLLTAVRSGELLNAEWKHLDLQNSIWNLPTTKNHKPFKVMLAPQTVGLFRELKELSATNKVMDNLSRGAMLKALARLQKHDSCGHTPLPLTEHVTCHDLRRSAATLLGEMDVPDDLVAQYLNHKRKGETATYNRALLLKQRLDAAILLANKLESLRV